MAMFSLSSGILAVLITSASYVYFLGYPADERNANSLMVNADNNKAKKINWRMVNVYAVWFVVLLTCCNISFRNVMFSVDWFYKCMGLTSTGSKILEAV